MPWLVRGTSTCWPRWRWPDLSLSAPGSWPAGPPRLDGASALPAPAPTCWGMRFAIDVAFCDADLVVLTLRTLEPNRLGPPVRRARDGPRGPGRRPRALDACSPATSSWSVRRPRASGRWSWWRRRSATSATCRPGRGGPGRPTPSPVRTPAVPAGCCRTPAHATKPCPSTTTPSPAASRTSWAASPGVSGWRWSATPAPRACPTPANAWCGRRSRPVTGSRSCPDRRPLPRRWSARAAHRAVRVRGLPAPQGVRSGRATGGDRGGTPHPRAVRGTPPAVADLGRPGRARRSTRGWRSHGS